jgi:hypothetical protein
MMLSNSKMHINGKQKLLIKLKKKLKEIRKTPWMRLMLGLRLQSNGIGITLTRPKVASPK